jgi:hypothetical protein
MASLRSTELFVIDVLSLASRMRRHTTSPRPQAGAQLASSAQSLAELFFSLSLPVLTRCTRALALACRTCAEAGSPLPHALAIELLDHIESRARLWHEEDISDADAPFGSAWSARLAAFLQPPAPGVAVRPDTAPPSAEAAWAGIAAAAPATPRSDADAGTAVRAAHGLEAATTDPRGEGHGPGAASPGSGPPPDVPGPQRPARPPRAPSPVEQARSLHAALPSMDEVARAAAEAEIVRLLASTRSWHAGLANAPVAVSAGAPVLAALSRAMDGMPHAGPAEISEGEDGIHLSVDLLPHADPEGLAAATAAHVRPWGGSVEVHGHRLHVRTCSDEYRWPVICLRVAEGWVAVPAPQFRGLTPIAGSSGGRRGPRPHWLASLRVGVADHALPCYGAGAAGTVMQPAWRFVLPEDWPPPPGWAGVMVTGDGRALPLWMPVQ